MPFAIAFIVVSCKVLHLFKRSHKFVAVSCENSCVISPEKGSILDSSVVQLQFRKALSINVTRKTYQSNRECT